MALTAEELETLNQRFDIYNTLCDLYKTDDRFTRFVDCTCTQYHLHKDIALLHATVQEVGKYYIQNPPGAKEECPKWFKDDNFTEDKAC